MPRREVMGREDIVYRLGKSREKAKWTLGDVIKFRAKPSKREGNAWVLDWSYFFKVIFSEEINLTWELFWEATFGLFGEWILMNSVERQILQILGAYNWNELNLKLELKFLGQIGLSLRPHPKIFVGPQNFFHPIISKLDSMQSYYIYLSHSGHNYWILIG